MEIKSLLPLKEQVGDIGVEIEVEADNIPTQDSISEYWRLEADGSLRGESGEFVLKKPLSSSDLTKALDLLSSSMRNANTRVRPTYRAGVHTHINVQDLTPKQLVTFIAAYFMMEEVFLSWCDQTRKGNHFCLRLSDASYTLDMITEMILTSNLKHVDTEDLRYASLNITSLFKYGSIEFRALESVTDFKRIETWSNALLHLRDFAKTLSNPTDLLNQASEQGFETFARSVFGPYYKDFGKFATEENIRTGIRNIQYAVYSKDWSNSNLNIFDKNINLFTS